MKLFTVTVLLTAYQNRNINLAYDITMTLLLKQCENVNFHETKQMIYRSKGDDDNFPLNVIFIVIELLDQKLLPSK